MLHLWYLDNGTFIGLKSSLLKLLDSFFGSWSPICILIYQSVSYSGLLETLSLNFLPISTKLVKVWSSQDPLFGVQTFFDQLLPSHLSKVVATQDSIAILEDLQVELHLLHSCLGSCKIIHLLPFSILHSILKEFGYHLKGCLSCILQCSLPGKSWCQAPLPFRLVGLGLHSSSFSAATAFLGSCNILLMLYSASTEGLQQHVLQP